MKILTYAAIFVLLIGFVGTVLWLASGKGDALPSFALAFFLALGVFAGQYLYTKRRQSR